MKYSDKTIAADKGYVLGVRAVLATIRKGVANGKSAEDILALAERQVAVLMTGRKLIGMPEIPENGVSNEAMELAQKMLQ